MKPSVNFSTTLSRFTDVPSSDPDDARRRKLLNILLVGLAVLAVLTVLIVFISYALGFIKNTSDLWLGVASTIGIVFGAAVFWFINRSQKIPGWVASFLFLLFLLIIFTFSDSRIELANGRSLFIFTIPIIMASILLRPSSSFLFALFGSIEISILARTIGTATNFFAVVGFFVVAFVAWLSARSLEQVLRDLREINTNLDKIVQERTGELAEALTRERIEAGRSQAILESIADGVIVLDTQGSAIQANPALSNLINVPLNEILSGNVDDFVKASPMDAKNKGVLAGLLTEPGTRPTNYRVEWGQKTISVSSGQVFDRDGGEVGIVAVFRDFTKEAELEKMKSAFVAMVSHELRTPLSAILGYAEIFKEQIYGQLNEKQMNMTERIVSNTKRLLGLINDLLDQAQMEAGKLKIKYEIIKPVELLENLHSVMDKITADKGLGLRSELDPALPETLTGDSARLQQILVNLVNNAVKFTNEGYVQVKLSLLNQQKWGITITDTGQGIPKDELPHIFETFRQVEGTTTRLHGGFGLGLSIVKQLVNLMGGTVSVESEMEKGTTFLITLPFESKI